MNATKLDPSPGGRSAQPKRRTHTSGLRANRGFSLIEVLIAAVVFVLGVVGLINLNSRIVAYQRTALVRASVASVVSSVSEMVRANPAADYSELYYPAGNLNGITTVQACTSNCTGTQWRDNDLLRLHVLFGSSNPTEGLVNGQGGYGIERVTQPGSTPAMPSAIYSVTVLWPEKDISAAGGTAATASSAVGARANCPSWATTAARTTPIQCIVTRVSL